MKANTFKLAGACAFGLALAQPASAAWVGGDNTLEPSTSISNPSFNSSSVGYTGNAALTYDAWGMQGDFTNFYVTQRVATLTIDARSSAKNYPGFTLFRTNVAWAGETVGPDATTLPEYGAIHDFNQVGQAGDPGIVWATGADGIVETLGYVSSSPLNYVNAFGGVVDSGAHDVSVDNHFETGIAGSIGTTGNPAFATSKRYATLTLDNVTAGWYTLFVGGSYAGGQSAGISVTVTAGAPAPVPVPAAVWLFGTAAAALGRVARRARA